MYSVLLTVQQAAEQTADAAQEIVSQAPANDVIGIGGIVATILVGMITCLVTWKVAMRSIKQLKLSYNIQIFPILSNSVAKNTGINFDDLKIQYKDKNLSNPCLLALEIVNTGNEAISNPPIKVRVDENIEIIPGYFEDIPSGYEELWGFNKTVSNLCDIHLEHINPKQVVKARFFLDNLPQKKVVFECPMQNVQTQEVSYRNTSATNRMDISTKSNIILICITVLLYITIPQWSGYIGEFIWITQIHLNAHQAVIFIMALLILSIVMNVYGVPVLDRFVKSHPKYSIGIRLALIVISFILLALIICDYIIIHFVAQMVTAIVVIVLLSLFIHLTLVSKDLQ